MEMKTRKRQTASGSGLSLPIRVIRDTVLKSPRFLRRFCRRIASAWSTTRGRRRNHESDESHESGENRFSAKMNTSSAAKRHGEWDQRNRTPPDSCDSCDSWSPSDSAAALLLQVIRGSDRGVLTTDCTDGHGCNEFQHYSGPWVQSDSRPFTLNGQRLRSHTQPAQRTTVWLACLIP